MRHAAEAVGAACAFLLVAFVLCLPMSGRAEGRWGHAAPTYPRLELAAGLGWLDRATTGIGAPLLGRGYDHASGLAAELGGRVYLGGPHRDLQHTLMLVMMHQAGSALGLTDDAAFQLSNLDLAYGMRIRLPCISEPGSTWYLMPFAGVSVAHARTDDDQARAVFDHEAIGGVLGASFDWRPGVFVVGATLAVREHVGLGPTPVARDFMLSLGLRAGLVFDL